MRFPTRFAPAFLAPVAILAAFMAPACGDDANCEAVPTCEATEIEVESCEGRGDCRENELCGVTIFCQEKGEECFAGPECTPPAIEVQTCPPASTCENVSACGSTIICATDSTPGTCLSNAECGATQFCNFPDGECGAGEPGVCIAQPMVCSDGPAVCYCDGTITMDGDLGCEGWMGRDFDETGTACTLPATAFACGHLVCDQGTTDYCRKTANDTGGPPYVSCSMAPQGCDPAACACLTEIIDGCGGTCTDGPNGPTVVCPGG
jgi:hypothetical protein